MQLISTQYFSQGLGMSEVHQLRDRSRGNDQTSIERQVGFLLTLSMYFLLSKLSLTMKNYSLSITPFLLPWGLGFLASRGIQIILFKLLIYYWFHLNSHTIQFLSFLFLLWFIAWV